MMRFEFERKRFYPVVEEVSYDHSEQKYLQHALEIERLDEEHPNLKSIKFNFQNSFFDPVDIPSYSESVLANFSLEDITIWDNDTLLKLPPILSQHPLKRLSYYSTKPAILGDVFGTLSELEELSLVTPKVDLRNGLDQLKHLKCLTIHCDEVIGFEQICLLTNLEYLELKIPSLSELPADFHRLKKLKVFDVDDCNLTEIVPKESLSNLQSLHLRLVTKLERLGENIINSPELKKIHVYPYYDDMKCTLQLPQRLNLPNLEELELGVRLIHFPECRVPNLKKLYSSDIDANVIIQNIGDCKGLTNLGLSRPEKESMENRKLEPEMPLPIWPSLTNLRLGNSGNFKINFEHYPAVTNVTLHECCANTELKNFSPTLCHFSLTGSYVESIEFTSNKVVELQTFEIVKCKALQQISLDGRLAPNIHRMHLNSCPTLTKLSAEFLWLKPVQNCYITNLEADTPYIDAWVQDLNDVLKYTQKQNFSELEIEALGYWVFRHHQLEDPTDQIIKHSYQLLELPNKLIHDVIGGNYHLFNEEEKSINDLDPSSIAQRKAAVIGNTITSKTTIKQELKEIGFQVTAKIEEAEFLMVGKKAPFSKYKLQSNVVLFSEQNLNEYRDKNAPKFLKAESISSNSLENLGQILHAGNDDSDLLALEIMKTGGLPDDLRIDAIAVLKTSTNDKVRAGYRKFLKANLNSEYYALIQDRTKFENEPYQPFYSRGAILAKYLDQLVLAVYLRQGSHWENILNFSEVEKYQTLRKEIIAKHVIPEIQKNPISVDLSSGLTSEELTAILEMKELEGVIEELKLCTNDINVLTNLERFPGLLSLSVFGALKESTIPDEIYKLKNLKYLRLNMGLINVVDKRIGTLTELAELILFGSKKVKLPDELANLKELRYLGFEPEDEERWKHLLK